MSFMRSVLRMSAKAQAMQRCSRSLSTSTRQFQRAHQLLRSEHLSTTSRLMKLSPVCSQQPAIKREFSTAPGSDGSAAVPGFSYPGPRKLSEVVKIQLLNKHGAPRVREIWNEYHKDHKSAVGDTLSSEEYGLLLQRTERCRHFVFPVPR